MDERPPMPVHLFVANRVQQTRTVNAALCSIEFWNNAGNFSQSPGERRLARLAISAYEARIQELERIEA